MFLFVLLCMCVLKYRGVVLYVLGKQPETSKLKIKTEIPENTSNNQTRTTYPKPIRVCNASFLEFLFILAKHFGGTLRTHPMLLPRHLVTPVPHSCIAAQPLYGEDMTLTSATEATDCFVPSHTASGTCAIVAAATVQLEELFACT